MLAVILLSAVAYFVTPALPVTPSSDGATPPGAAVVAGWSVNWTLGHGIATRASGTVQEMAPNATQPDQRFFIGTAFTDPDPSGAIPTCNSMDNVRIELFFGNSDQSNIQILADLEPPQQTDWTIVTAQDPTVFVERPVESLFLSAFDPSVAIEAKCDGPDHLRVSMTLQATLHGDTKPWPLFVDTTASLPIVSMDDY